MEKVGDKFKLRTNEVFHGPNTRFMGNSGAMAFRPAKGTQLRTITKEAYSTLADTLGFPVSYLKDLTPKTCCDLLSELGSKREKYYTIMNQEGQIVGFTKPNKAGTPVNIDRALTVIERVIPDTNYNRVLFPDQGTVELEVIGPSQDAVVKDDIVQAGALVRFSPIGINIPVVQSFAVRQWCMNGCTTHDSLAEYKFNGGGGGDSGGNGGGDIYRWMRDATKEAYKSLPAIMAIWRELLSKGIDPHQRGPFLEALLKEAGITGANAVAVRDYALQHPPANEYDMYHMVTWAASHVLKEPKAISRARKASEAFASADAHRAVCPLCKRDTN